MGKNGSKKQKYYSSLVVHVCSWPDLEECSSKDPLWRCCCARLDLCIERGGCFGFVCVSPSCLNACRLFLCAREVVVVLTNAKVLRYKKSSTPLCTPVFSSWPPPLCVVASEEEEEEAFCTAKNTNNNNNGWFLRRRRLLHA